MRYSPHVTEITVLFEIINDSIIAPLMPQYSSFLSVIPLQKHQLDHANSIKRCGSEGKIRHVPTANLCGIEAYLKGASNSCNDIQTRLTR